MRSGSAVERFTIESEVLRDNRIGASPVRTVDVYVPPGGAAGRPLLVDLVGFTGSGLSHTNWRAFGENVPARADRLIAGGMAPAVIAFPDCFTRLGGNQYIDSVVLGRWEAFLCDELVPELERRYGCGGAGRRGVFGKSSGGYGAIVHAMRRSDVWAAAACHSGDMGFEWCYAPDFPRTLRELAARGYSPEAVVTAVERTSKPSDDLQHALEILAMCASYDPDPHAPLGIRLPFDLYTCELVPERWARWQAWDPVRMLDAHVSGLRTLRGLYIDCGTRDQYNLVYGARRVHAALDRHGVAHRYEEFDDDHSAVDYRMDQSLPYLAAALG